MKKFIKVSVYIILAFLVLMLTEANSKILDETNQIEIKFLGSWFETYFPIIKAASYSLATIVIIVAYRNLVIRVGFIALDAFIVFIYHYVHADVWFKYSAVYYALLTGLIFVFIGNIAHKFYFDKSQLKLNRNSKELNSGSIELDHKHVMIQDLQRRITNLKRTGQSKIKWQDDPTRLRKIEDLEKEIEKLLN